MVHVDKLNIFSINDFIMTNIDRQLNLSYCIWIYI